MKDAYSFDVDPDGARAAYNRMFVAYLRTFQRMGLSAIPMRADTGPIGGDLSHEFIILAETGESQVFCDRALLDLTVPGEDTDFGSDLSPIVSAWTTPYAATEEKHDEAAFAALAPERQISARGIEVGHIFYFGTKYSEPMGAKVVGPNGDTVAVEGGSYGIGVSRLVGAIIEASHDDAGIVWPEPIAPWRVGLVTMRADDEATVAAADQLYEMLSAAGVEVLYDDRDERGGVKLGSMELIGLPWQVVVGPRGIAAGTVELKRRSSGEREELSIESVLARLTA
jgi:prolyl-tRNA synthetase